MTSREYVEWFDHAKAAFPALHRLFDGGGEAKRRSQQWLSALGRIQLAHAIAAIDAMVRGDAKPPSYDWAQLPAAVIAYGVEQGNLEAIQRVESYYDGPTVRCPHCRDSRSGFVSVWNPWFINDCSEQLLACESLHTVHEIFREWKHAGQERKYETFSMACFCGSPAAEAKRKEGRAYTFNPKRGCTVSSVVGLHEFLRDDTRHEFDPDEWN